MKIKSTTFVKPIEINSCIDKWRTQAHFDYVLDSLKFVVNDMFGTLSDLQTDNTLIPAHPLAAYHNLHIHNNPHGNLYPLIRHEQFPQYLQLVLFL